MRIQISEFQKCHWIHHANRWQWERQLPRILRHWSNWRQCLSACSSVGHNSNLMKWVYKVNDSVEFAYFNTDIRFSDLLMKKKSYRKDSKWPKRLCIQQKRTTPPSWVDRLQVKISSATQDMHSLRARQIKKMTTFERNINCCYSNTRADSAKSTRKKINIRIICKSNFSIQCDESASFQGLKSIAWLQVRNDHSQNRNLDAKKNP